MKKGKKIGIQKGEIKKVAQSGSQGIEKHTIAKRNRGITLIALVVTIIIMLILAAVTLNMALGDNGLIQMAKFATNKYEEAAINESLAMGELAKGLGGGSESGPTTPTETPEGGGGGGTTEEPKTASDLTEDNYGDYVDYELDLSGDGDTTNDWRIFYVGDESNGDANGRIFLIAADYVPNSCQELIEAQKSEHANMTKVEGTGYDVCCSHWSYPSLPEYHCYDGRESTPNSEKPQCSFPEIFMPSGSFCNEGNHYYCSSHIDLGAGSRCASSLQCTGNWNSFVKSEYADYAIGGPTLEMWVASWNQKHGKNAEEPTLYANGHKDSDDEYGYSVGEEENCTSRSCDLKTTAGYGDTLYFPHTSAKNLNLFEDKKTENATCWGYWLSSPSVAGNTDLMYVDYYETLTFTEYVGSVGVRPVISLKSGVTLTNKTSTDDRVVYDINT